MWKSTIALICAFTCVSNAFRSNPEILDYGHYEALPITSFDYVVSLGLKTNGTEVRFIHMWSGIMLTQQIGLSPAVYYQRRVILGRGVLPGLYAHLPRSTTAGNNTYLVEDFVVLEGPEHESRHLNLLRSFQLEAEIPLSHQSLSTPIYKNSKHISVDSMIGRNNIERNVLPEREYLKFPVRLIPASRCEAEPQVGQFCIEPVHDRHAFTWSDVGGLVLHENKIVGLMTDSNGRAEAVFGASALVCHEKIIYPSTSTSE